MPSGPLHGRQHTYALLEDAGAAKDRDEALTELAVRLVTAASPAPRKTWPAERPWRWPTPDAPSTSPATGSSGWPPGDCMFLGGVDSAPPPLTRRIPGRQATALRRRRRTDAAHAPVVHSFSPTTSTCSTAQACSTRLAPLGGSGTQARHRTTHWWPSKADHGLPPLAVAVRRTPRSPSPPGGDGPHDTQRYSSRLSSARC